MNIRRAFAPLLLSLALALASAAPLRAQVNLTGKTVTAYQPTTTAMKLVSPDPTITAVVVVNNGTVTAYLGGTSSVTAAASASTDGLPLYGKTQITFSNVKDGLYAITQSGTADLRVAVFRGGGGVEFQRLQTQGITNSVAANEMGMSDGSNLVTANARVLNLTTAIAPNSTTTTTPAGTFAITSNATGLGTVFRSDGSLWQLLPNYSDRASETDAVTIATTGNTDTYVIAPFTGVLISADFSGTDVLAASDTNYITFSITNLAQNGAGTNTMLAATAANTTQATGGSALVANSKRSLTLNGTASNLLVTAGDRIRVRFAATGTLANAVTFSKAVLRFTRQS